MQVQAWRGGDEYRRRILPTKALRRATGVLYLLTAKTQEQERGMWVPEHVRREILFVLTVPYVCPPPPTLPKMCSQRQIHNLRGWGNSRYLFNYELRFWSWSSESWTLISIFSSLRRNLTPPNTSQRAQRPRMVQWAGLIRMLLNRTKDRKIIVCTNSTHCQSGGQGTLLSFLQKRETARHSQTVSL